MTNNENKGLIKDIDINLKKAKYDASKCIKKFN